LPYGNLSGLGWNRDLAPHVAILSTKRMSLGLGLGDFYHRAEELLGVRGWVSAGVDLLKEISSSALAGSGTTIVF